MPNAQTPPALGLSGPELDRVAREIHGMWHAGAPRREAFLRLRSRLSQGRWDEQPRWLRPFWNAAIRMQLGHFYSAKPCRPGHEIEICDRAARPV